VTDPQGHAVTVATLGNMNCTSVAQFLGDQFPTATVIDPTGNAEDTECLYLGFSPAP
jgi:hypothetical protein